MPKKIVVIGGGHGTSVILSGLKAKDVELAAIISMADNGGSTGRLRKELGVSAAGDIRNCLAALCDPDELGDLFSYRFSSGELEGHSLGNLFLAAGELSNSSIQKSIDFARQALGVRAEIFPISLDNSQLIYRAKGKTVAGMYQIAKIELGPKPNLSLEPRAKLSPQSKNAITKADLVVIAPGNFYCSIAQSLIVDGLAETLDSSPAKVALVTNLVNIDRHNRGFSPGDYLLEANRLLGREVIDRVIYNSETIDPKSLKTGESQVETSFDQSSLKTVKFQAAELASKIPVRPDPNDKIAFIRSTVQHDKQKLAEIILAL